MNERRTLYPPIDPYNTGRLRVSELHDAQHRPVRDLEGDAPNGPDLVPDPLPAAECLETARASFEALGDVVERDPSKTARG